MYYQTVILFWLGHLTSNLQEANSLVAFFHVFKASHWPSDPMISSRPLIGQPIPPPPGLSTQLVHPARPPTRSPYLSTPLVHSTRDALKTRSCSGLDLGDRPRVGGVRLVDCPCMEP